jgi:hypothetical protein
MSEASPAPLLHALADGGVAAVPPERCEDVAVECDARARATGDARYPVIQPVLLETFEWWDERGGVPRAIANQIQDVITKELPPTLGASSPADGYVPRFRAKPALAGKTRSGRSRTRTWDLFLIRERPGVAPSCDASSECLH